MGTKIIMVMSDANCFLIGCSNSSVFLLLIQITTNLLRHRKVDIATKMLRKRVTAINTASIMLTIRRIAVMVVKNTITVDTIRMHILRLTINIEAVRTNITAKSVSIEIIKERRSNRLNRMDRLVWVMMKRID